MTKVNQLKDMMKAKKDAEDRKSNINTKVEQHAPAEQSQNQKDDQAADEITEQIKAAENEAKEHYDKLLRVMAEFDNYKKRIEREKAEQAKYANQSLICDLLPVIDDFDRVLGHIPAEATSEVAAIADGVKLIQSHFLGGLQKHGFSPLETSVGKKFDPTTQEAVAHVESEIPEGCVAIEHRRGWMLHDRVVRAAMVTVSKGLKK